jgi:hypothetical protein
LLLLVLHVWLLQLFAVFVVGVQLFAHSAMRHVLD